MASSGLNFENITPDNGAVRELSKLLFENILAPEALGALFNVIPNVHNGDALALVGEFGLVGTAKKGCNPVWGHTAIQTTEKKWDIARWGINEEICFADLENTLVKYALASHTEARDLTDNVYIEKVIRPRLEEAIKKMLFRIAVFGDKNATAHGSGGVLADGVDAKYFTLTNGLWKQLTEIVTKDENRRTPITANAKTTYAEQKAEILKNGVATNIIDEMIFSAPAKLRQSAKQVIYITLALKDALDRDIKGNNNGSDLQWKALFNGVHESMYNGIKMVAVPMMDEIIQGYEANTAGTGWNNPYRAIYTTQDNLAIGTSSVDEFANVKITFNDDKEVNQIAATDTIGALVVQDDLLQVAY